MSSELRAPWKAVSPLTDTNALDVYDASGSKLHHGHWGGMNQARLIAAAPELLVALKLILQTHDVTCKGEDCHIGGIDLARSAIAKAEGAL